MLLLPVPPVPLLAPLQVAIKWTSELIWRRIDWSGIDKKNKEPDSSSGRDENVPYYGTSMSDEWWDAWVVMRCWGMPASSRRDASRDGINNIPIKSCIGFALTVIKVLSSYPSTVHEALHLPINRLEISRPSGHPSSPSRFMLDLEEKPHNV